MIVFEIHFNFLFILFIRLKTRRSVFLKKIKMCAPERVWSTLGEHFSQAWIITTH